VKYELKTFVCDNVFMIIVLCEVQGRFRVHLSGWQPQKLCSASLCDMGRIVRCTSSLLNMIFFADSSAKDDAGWHLGQFLKIYRNCLSRIFL